MACLGVAAVGNSLQVWKIATNILNKQLRTTDKGCSSGFGVGREGKQLVLKRTSSYVRLHRAAFGITNRYKSDQKEEKEMGGTCSTHGRGEK
jgi:hypothetical protein